MKPEHLHLVKFSNMLLKPRFLSFFFLSLVSIKVCALPRIMFTFVKSNLTLSSIYNANTNILESVSRSSSLDMDVTMEHRP